MARRHILTRREKDRTVARYQDGFEMTFWELVDAVRKDEHALSKLEEEHGPHRLFLVR